MDRPQTSKGLVDEYEPHNSCEYLLSEPSEQLHHSTRVESNQPNHKDCGPQSNPESEIEEWDIVHRTEVEDNLLKDNGRSSCSKYHKRLPREYAEHKIANTNSDDHLCCSLWWCNRTYSKVTKAGCTDIYSWTNSEDVPTTNVSSKNNALI